MSVYGQSMAPSLVNCFLSICHTCCKIIKLGPGDIEHWRKPFFIEVIEVVKENSRGDLIMWLYFAPAQSVTA